MESFGYESAAEFEELPEDKRIIAMRHLLLYGSAGREPAAGVSFAILIKT